MSDSFGSPAIQEDFSKYGRQVFHNGCHGEIIQGYYGKVECKKCNQTWNSPLKQDHLDQMYSKAAPDNTTYRLVEVQDGKVRYTHLVPVEEVEVAVVKDALDPLEWSP